MTCGYNCLLNVQARRGSLHRITYKEASDLPTTLQITSWSVTKSKEKETDV